MITYEDEPKPAGFKISVVHRKSDIDDHPQEPEELNEEKENYFLLKYTSDQHKNIDVVLSAFASSFLKHVSLIVAAGNQTDVISLEKLRRSRNVTVVSSSDAELLNYLYTKALGFINCSLTEISRLTIIKAQRWLCRLVLSDTKTFRNLVGNKATFFDPASVESVIAAIQSALKDSQVQ
ncbi:glycosyltransferase [Mucilaginibacter celer]|uniref:Glycosyltransferase n=1 Tax=Mucilaginibacter celer TaxID=2305508 RepID=A0A494VJL5_9SPHI|nr:glycosyltransferase [Mucilaginibacter celer]AYL95256.1 glycosyltransferase [Mucilaginibacter celer]